MGGGRTALVFGGGATKAIDTAPCLSSHGGRFDFDTEALAVDTHNGLVSSETTGTLLSAQDRGNRGHAVIAFDLAQVTSKENRSNPQPGGPAPSLAETSRPALAFHHKQHPISAEVSMPIGATTDGMGLMTPRGRVRRLTPRGRVRRLTPRECERLQGFEDDYTKLDDDTADGPRYRALGNSMAVPVMQWIGRRVDAVERALRRAA